MTIRITPSPKPYESLYEEILASIPAGTQWHTGPVTLPLSSSEPTPFILEGDVGDVVDVFHNNRLVHRLTLTSPALQLSIMLVAGKNFIQVRTPGEDFLLLVVATNYATILKGFAEDLFYNVDVKFKDAQNQLNSPLSLRAVEHQIGFQELLPSTRAMRVLAGKLAVRSLVNETGSTRGVDDIVTAASNTTPVVQPTVVDLELFEPSIRSLYSTAHDEGGFAFHIWVPSICIGTWAAFIKLMDNLESSIAELISVSDELVTLNFLGRREQHRFDSEDNSCSILSLLSYDCLPIVVSVLTRVESELAFCAWRYPFDVVVALALGRSRLDSRSLFSVVIPAGALLIDTTGSATGVLGAAYFDLPNPIEAISSATVIGGGLISALRVPGSSRVFFPLGDVGRPISVRYEGSIPFDIGIPLDSREESDPLGDGWYGLPLVSRFDGGTCLDSTVPEVSLFEDLECCFVRPQSTLAVSSLLSVTIPLTISASSGLLVIH